MAYLLQIALHKLVCYGCQRNEKCPNQNVGEIFSFDVQVDDFLQDLKSSPIN